MKEEKNRTWENMMETERVDCCKKEQRLLINMRESVEE